MTRVRRPSPLPPPPERPPAAPPREGADDDAPVPAPVLPFAPVVREDDDSVREDDSSIAPAEAARERWSLRDVWRASRARRRALRAEVRRFTVRQRRRRMMWIGIAAAVAVLVLGTVGAAYSPLFAVQRIEVVGTSQLDAGEVTAALDGQLGTPLALVDSSEVKAALVRFPLVESYTLEARPPHDLVVRIVERTPVGVLRSAAGYTVVDAAGVALSTTPEAPSGQPLLSVPAGTNSPAFRAAGTVMRALPAPIRLQVTAVSATTADDVTLTLGGTDSQVVWGSAEDSALKAFTLEKVMQSHAPQNTRVYDVSSPSAIVVR